MKESNYKKLVYNTAIFAIGNFGSKVLTFLIVPLYTYVLTTAEYGVIDFRGNSFKDSRFLEQCFHYNHLCI